MSKLHITEGSLFIPTESSASSQSDEPGEEPAPPSKQEHLNTFLASCGIAPVVRSWQKWDGCSDSTKQRYTKKSAEMVSAVLKTVSPDETTAAKIWDNLVSSQYVPELLGIDSLSTSEKRYLETLGEAYASATGWETRRQLLSIMAGVTSFKNLCIFIPGLTRYRYSVANLHRLQHGAGAKLPSGPIETRLRVDTKQLDHFLDFITSPHLVQDLPFGKKNLKLSTGEIIEVPNVIRTMIPQRIAQQYQQYCEESDFTPFSQRTMLRVLSECRASVRKSLQGLDYYAADGAQAFDTLLTLISQLSELGSGKEWEKRIADALKASKTYLKGDYKVLLQK